MKITKAIILSAGFGKRLLPLTNSTPKPLLKIGTKNLLENSIDILEEFGINEIVINSHHLSKQIISFIDKKKKNIKIKVLEEKDKILDTGGGILNAISKLNCDSFFVLNPDTIWLKGHLKEFKQMENFFHSKACKAIILLVKKNKSFDKSFQGDFNFKNQLVYRDPKLNNFIYTGAQILKKECFNNFKIEPFSVNKIWNKLILEKKLMSTESKQDFFHVSTLKIYKLLLKKIPTEIKF